MVQLVKVNFYMAPQGGVPQLSASSSFSSIFVSTLAIC